MIIDEQFNWMDGWMDGKMDGWMVGWMDGLEGKTDGWMGLDELMDGLMDGWKNSNILSIDDHKGNSIFPPICKVGFWYEFFGDVC